MINLDTKIALLIQAETLDELTAFSKDFSKMKSLLKKVIDKDIFVNKIKAEGKVYFTIELVTMDKELFENITALCKEQKYELKSKCLEKHYIMSLDKGCLTKNQGNDLKAFCKKILGNMEFDFKTI